MPYALESVPFSELLRHPAETAQRLTHTRAVRLRRRDAADLLLMSAERAEAEGEVTDLTGRLLASILRRNPSLVHELLPIVLPWARFLPTEDLEIMAAEFIAVTEAASSAGNMAPAAQVLAEWRHTAEVHSDADLHHALTARPLDDFGPVVKPDVR